MKNGSKWRKSLHFPATERGSEVPVHLDGYFWRKSVHLCDLADPGSRHSLSLSQACNTHFDNQRQEDSMKRSLPPTLFVLVLVLSFSQGIFASGGNCANFAAGSCPASVPSGVTGFYFIDYIGGSDSNNGMSESTPWQHAPTMANATGAAAGHTPAAGEGWIFKGGVTVDYRAWPMNVPWNGTSAAPDYIGPDPGWYTGSSWSRPIFNGGGSSGYDATNQSLITDAANAANYLVLDNIEFTGLYWHGLCPSSSNAACGYVGTNSAYGRTNWEVKNVYAHGWGHCSYQTCNDSSNSNGAFFYLGFPNTNASTNVSSFHDSVVDGSDTAQDCCQAAHAPYYYRNYVAYVANYSQGMAVSIHDNTFAHNVSSFQQVNGGDLHENCIHLWEHTWSFETPTIYNNYLSCQSALPVSYVTQVMLFEDNSLTHYVFNNVVEAGNGQGIAPSAYAAGDPASTYFIFNNTIETMNGPTPGSSCYTSGYTAKVTYADNFCLTNNYWSTAVVPSLAFYGYTGTTSTPSPTFSINCRAGGGTQSNFGASQICAPIGSGDGSGNINATEAFPFAPMDTTASATIGTGQNNSAYCTAVSAVDSAAGTACLSDTTLGVAYNVSNHTVSWPARTPIMHSASGTWQNGAYEYSGGNSGNPAPPTNLTAVVQ